MKIEADNFYRVKDVMRLLGYSSTKPIYKMIKERKLKAAKPSGHYLIKGEWILDCLLPDK